MTPPGYLVNQGECLVKVIFVEFPDIAPITYTPDMEVVFDEMAEFLEQQSSTEANYHSDPDRFIFEAEVVQQPISGAKTWEADYGWQKYSSEDSVLTIERYGDYWEDVEGSIGGGIEVAYAGELQAEILCEIDSVYTSAGQPSPFDGADMIYYIYFMDDYDQDMFSHADGFSGTMIRWNRFDILSGMNPAFYDTTIFTDSTACRSPYGTTQVWAEAPDYEARFGSILPHELGHQFVRDSHTPKTSEVQCETSEEIYSYYYGPYSLMRADECQGKPFVPFIYYDLQKIGWLDPPILVTSDTTGLRVDEIRRGGQVVRIWLDRYDYRATYGNAESGYSEYGYDQYFEIMFHGGVDEESRTDLSTGTDPTYRSQGLAIWHAVYMLIDGVVQAVPMCLDLEVSSGLFSDPGTWGEPDSVHGYDNHDIWYDRADSCAHREVGGPNGIYSYFGDVDDFWDRSTKDEFSYRSNPSTATYPYVECDEGEMCYDGFVRSILRPQTEQNSMVIKITDQGTDYAVIDVLYAPYEEVTAPVAGEDVVKGVPYDIRWGNEHPIIDTCDILVAYDGAAWDTLAVDFNVTLQSYTWTPDETAGTADIKIIYHNVNTDYTEPCIVEDINLVEPTNVVFENKSTDTGLNYSGQPYSAVGVDYYNDGATQARDYEDLFVSIRSSDPSLNLCDYVSAGGVPYFSSPPNALPGSLPSDLKGASYADYDNDGDMDLFVAGGATHLSYLCRNNGSGQYETLQTSILPENLDSSVYAGVWADYDGDGWVDLFLCRGNESDGVAVADYLLRNDLSDSGVFQDVTSSLTYGGGMTSQTSSHAAVWADVNGDDLLDLFVANNRPLDSPPSAVDHCRLFMADPVNLGQFSEESATRFSGLVDDMSQMTAVDMADIDLDGDVDLVAGYEGMSCCAIVYRNNGSGYFQSDDAIFLNGFDSTSGVRFYDPDLDGWPDLLVTSQDTGTEPRHFRNVGALNSAKTFVPVTDHIFPVDPGTSAEGLVTLDWNRDGDTDVFLGRAVSSGDFFYRTKLTDGTDAPTQNVIALRLSSPQGVNNRAGIGAKVVVSFDNHTLVQWVDGGSSRGGQDDLVLTFPVEQSSGNIPISITWPNGWEQTALARIHTAGSAPEDVLDNTNPTIRENSVIGYSSFDPATGYSLVFNWATEYGFDPALDKVVLKNSAGLKIATLTASTPDVTIEQDRQSDGSYRHTLIWESWDCEPFTSVYYEVTSQHRPRISDTSEEKSFYQGYCLRNIWR